MIQIFRGTNCLECAIFLYREKIEESTSNAIARENKLVNIYLFLPPGWGRTTYHPLKYPGRLPTDRPTSLISNGKLAVKLERAGLGGELSVSSNLRRSGEIRREKVFGSVLPAVVDGSFAP